MNSKLFLVAVLVPAHDCDKAEGKIQSRASQKYTDNWDGIFGKKDVFESRRPEVVSN